MFSVRSHVQSWGLGKRVFQSLMVLGLALSFSSASFAKKGKMDKMKEHHEKMMNMSKEDREKMAANHEKMATCLRSDKTMKECHEEMMVSCADHDAASCPMMGHGMKHHGMMGHGKMKGEEKEKTENSDESKK